jgi:DNA (cytosine-5)-methyltransferase 1
MQVIDLFAGCGGLSLGLEKSGMKVVHAFDNWEKSNHIYDLNFSHGISKVDVSDFENTIKNLKKYKFDLIAGGPPCQDFSSAGKRDQTLGRADLTYSYSDVINEIKPEWFIMENVPLIKNSLILKNIVSKLSISYGLTAVVLNSAYFNVPQSRKRFFLIGNLGGYHNALVDYFKKEATEKPMTVREYFGTSLGLTHYYRHPRNYSRRAIFSIDEPSSTVRGVNRPLPPTFKEKGMVPEGIDLKDVRALSTKERSLIQTFPKDFILEGTKGDLEQMIGNAVPVKLAELVGNVINSYINEPRTNDMFELDKSQIDSIKVTSIP